ncbi:MAG: apolipoprotein N-acyltransferase [Proteobacteria bacterium]|nr:apolipoprotein N-acyltransferase [Pseudomonadota bacterium]
MLTTFKNIFHKTWVLSLLSGLTVFLAFEEFAIVPLILFFPFFFNSMVSSSPNLKQAFAWGFFTSFIVMLGGFYWVTYVIHEFGNLPWGLSALLFLGFCGFGALNFPIFSSCSFWIERTFQLSRKPLLVEGLWYALGVPALFTLCEWAIPKLFPWYISHSFYRQLWLIQICEFTGATFLTFSLYSFGSTLGWLFKLKPSNKRRALGLLAIPSFCLLVLVAFSTWTLRGRSFQMGREIKVALIQANIGSLEKLHARQGVISLIDQVLNTYQEQTRFILEQKPDLILWPETAIPVEMDQPSSRQAQVIQFIRETGIPLITGAYATSPHHVYRDYNSAFLFDPTVSPLHVDTYHKNILLAFGEYFPLGDTFPSLYKLFPQVSDFERGKTQNIFTLSDGTRLGTSICYEAIVPSFMRKIGSQGVHALVNLTNDSWFGPTSEPHLHGALTIFRAIEHRVPLMRVTNTGTSFVVNHFGEMSSKTAVYKPETSVRTLKTTISASPTPYAIYGDWFIAICSLVLVIFIFIFRRTREALSV